VATVKKKNPGRKPGFFFTSIILPIIENYFATFRMNIFSL